MGAVAVGGCGAGDALGGGQDGTQSSSKVSSARCCGWVGAGA